jgi:hypothetical protein
MVMSRARFSLLAFLAALPLATDACSAQKIPQVDRPTGIRIDVGPDVVNTATARLPITFRPEEAKIFTVDVTMLGANGAVRNDFTGPNAWVRLTLSSGQIVKVIGPAGATDPDVVATDVHLTDGRIKGLKVQVIGAYGDTRIVAQDVGFVPAKKGTLSQCQNGVDDDGNGVADYPVDPGCYFLNDDTEASGTDAYGVSPTIYYDFPRIHDVQGGTSTSRFNAKQVEIVGGTGRQMVITSVTNDGMFVTDVDDFSRGFNSLYVYNFNAPCGVRWCDKVTRLAGNLSNFYGFTELGTPGWAIEPWINETVSGPCPIPGFQEINEVVAADSVKMQSLSSALVVVKDPIIGTHFGSARPSEVNGVPTPSDGASNCDLNGDGVVGFNAKKAGFDDKEKACNDLCGTDADCSEWNNFLSRGTVKVKFGTTNAVLYFDPGLIQTLDVQTIVGKGKIAEIRGNVRVFVGPTPPYTVQARCADDVVLVGQDATTIKDAAHACVRARTCTQDEEH